MTQSFAPPRKALGQNFLQDANIIRKIVASLNIQEQDVVLEIGPGRGALTEHILPLARQLHLVEFDRDLAQYWRDRAAGVDNLRVYEQDILDFDLAVASKECEDGQCLKVIGNLPYNISSPILFYLMHYAELIEQQVLMLQKEVVERMSAGPGSKQYGRLSVMLQYRYDIENLFSVPATAFYPPPKVDSAIARLSPKRNLDHPINNPEDFALIVKQAFSQRRKTIRNTLKKHLSVSQLEQAGVDPGCRAETLDVDIFVNMANLYSAAKAGHHD